MNRFVTIAAALLAFVPMLAHAQTTAPVYQGQDGQTKEAIGTFPVGGGASTGTNAPQAQGSAANGTPIATAGNPQVVAGSDGTNVRTLSTDAFGRIGISGVGITADGIAAPATGTTSAARVMAYNLVFNGTIWDRARGDTTGGFYVQERERSQFFAEAPAILAAAAVFNGATRDGAVSPSQWGSFSCFFRSDQASATNGATLQGSNDATAWTTMQQTTLAAGTPTRLTERNDMRYHRCMLTNGATANTVAPILNASFGN